HGSEPSPHFGLGGIICGDIRKVSLERAKIGRGHHLRVGVRRQHTARRHAESVTVQPAEFPAFATADRRTCLFGGRPVQQGGAYHATFSWAFSSQSVYNAADPAHCTPPQEKHHDDIHSPLRLPVCFLTCVRLGPSASWRTTHEANPCLQNH